MVHMGMFGYKDVFLKQGARPFNIAGKKLKGFVLVEEEAMDMEEELENWVQLSLNYNPLAEKSKKEKG